MDRRSLLRRTLTLLLSISAAVSVVQLPMIVL